MGNKQVTRREKMFPAAVGSHPSPCGGGPHHSTIEQWVSSMPTFEFYRERIVPLLSAEQRRKQLEFALRFLNNWGLGGGNFLLIHYDEKWFWGLVLRALAKACPDLGVMKQDYKTFHRNHINKVRLSSNAYLIYYWHCLGLTCVIFMYASAVPFRLSFLYLGNGRCLCRRQVH